MIELSEISSDRPVLIFGPTATGKSGLALRIAAAQGGVIVNADALQVYQGWKVLSAQPTAEDCATAAHLLYGHLPFGAPYSVGDWLREVTPILETHKAGGPRPIIVGGTGLNFTALTEGLADIPATPAKVRAEANAIPLPQLIADLDAKTADGLDLQNRARVQRAWEVQRSTGRSIRHWQDSTPPPLLPLSDCTAMALTPDVDWLNDRIARRFDLMMQAGAADEARAMLPRWDPAAPSSKTIGAAEMIAFVQGQIGSDSLKEAVIVATRQYAKRQRTWLRSRMKGWRHVALPDVGRGG
ncbi:MAG: tRNA (adenosine(37)-N6)-dimethylallyltransferase MiaA [Pseudomonadota bacterium]